MTPVLALVAVATATTTTFGQTALTCSWWCCRVFGYGGGQSVLRAPSFGRWRRGLTRAGGTHQVISPFRPRDGGGVLASHLHHGRPATHRRRTLHTVVKVSVQVHRRVVLDDGHSMFTGRCQVPIAFSRVGLDFRQDLLAVFLKAGQGQALWRIQTGNERTRPPVDSVQSNIGL